MTARLAAIDEIAGRTAADARWSSWVNMLDGLSYLATATDGVPSAATDGVPSGATGADDEPVPGDEPSGGEPTDGEGADAPTGAALF